MAKIILDVDPMPKDGEVLAWNAKRNCFVAMPFSALAGDFSPRLAKAERAIADQGKSIEVNSKQISVVAEIAGKGLK